jgi:DNA-binding CsgD family transcriptional regulator
MYQRGLSKRQKEAVSYVAQGLTARQIGTKMNCTEQTVKNFLYYARMKIQARNNAHLVYLVYVNESITSA